MQEERRKVEEMRGKGECREGWDIGSAGLLQQQGQSGNGT